jgi:uncharacterized NAD-dependent epimerase/dehydratase family protein
MLNVPVSTFVNRMFLTLWNNDETARISQLQKQGVISEQQANELNKKTRDVAVSSASADAIKAKNRKVMIGVGVGGGVLALSIIAILVFKPFS